MSVFKKTLLYLGLGPDEEYEYDAAPLLGGEGEVESGTVRELSPGIGGPVNSSGPSVRPVPMATHDPEPALRSDRNVSGLGDLSAPSNQSGLVAQPSRSVTGPSVRPIPMTNTSKPSTVAPASFNDAQQIADKFKSSQAVIVNLQNVERDLSRRIIDFTSGLCYGLGGQMERVAKDVYLLTPDDVVVADDDRRALIE